MLEKNRRLAVTLESNYGDLKRLAQHHLGRLPPGQTMNATALVHEAFVKVAKNSRETTPTEDELVTMLSYAIRDVLTSHVRSKMRMKRREDAYRLIKANWLDADDEPNGEWLLRLEDALEKLERVDPELASLVTLHVFGEIKLDRVAEILSVSHSTVKRRWRAAKAWLLDAMRQAPVRV